MGVKFQNRTRKLTGLEHIEYVIDTTVRPLVELSFNPGQLIQGFFSENTKLIYQNPRSSH